MRVLEGPWTDFLKRRGVDSEVVGIDDFIAFRRELAEDGFSAGDQHVLNMIRHFYLNRGSDEPNSRWSHFAAELKVQKMPRVIGKRHPHEPFPILLLPKILEASRHVVQRSPTTGAEVYSEAYALTGTLLYSGMRAQSYGLLDAQVEKALDDKYVQLNVKSGYEVQVPIHDRLREIWTEHLDKRDHEGPQFFRHGRDPYTYMDGNQDWREDFLALTGNGKRVQDVLRGRGEDGADSVQRELKVLYGVEERITAHRFRKSLGSYMEPFGFTLAERRLQLSHGARNITDFYSVAQVQELQVKLSKMDLGSAEWVLAHDPPSNLFAGNGDAALVEDLRRQLAASDERARRAEERAERMEKKLDEFMEKLAPATR